MKKNVASQVIGCQLISKTDGSAVTTGTTTVYVCGDAGTQAAGSVGSGACTHEGNGYWTYAPAQAETNYDQIAFTFVNTSACNATVQVYPTFPQTGDNYARLGAPAGASVSADVAAIQSDTNDIQTRIPAALVSGRIDASVGAMAAGVVTAAAIATDAIDNDAIAADVTAVMADAVWNAATASYGTAGTYGALVETNLDAAVSTRSTYAGGAVASVTGAVGSVTAGVTVTTNNDKTGYALSVTPPTAAQITTAVWDEAIAGHLTAGTTGNALNAAGSAGDPWATAIPGAYGAGTAGKILGDNINATVSSRASQTSVDTVAGYIDTEVAAIKAKTDSLTFTVAGQVDANIQSINDVTLVGNGSTTPFNV